MSTAANLRLQIEAALAHRIPSALTPAPRVIRPTAPTGIPALDDALGGGLPIGAITELAGPECSGRTSLALSFVAGLTQAARVCAWVDVSDTLHPESAAAAGVDLNRLLWIRCGREAEQLILPGFGAEQKKQETAWQKSQEKSETKNISATATNFPAPRVDFAPRCAEPQPTLRKKSREAVPVARPAGTTFSAIPSQPVNRSSETCALSLGPVAAKRPLAVREYRPLAVREYSRLDQALRATDLLLLAGGFSAIVLDMGSIAPEFALRVPLATWFRYRAAAERTHASVVLLTQHACTKSSAGLVLHCQPSQVDPESGAPDSPAVGVAGWESTTVFTGAEHRIEIARERFAPSTKVVDFDRRKPPQSDHSLLWQSRTPWACTRPIHTTKSGRK